MDQKRKNIHPNAPAGGGGPGAFRSVAPLGMNPDIDKWFHPGPIGMESQMCSIYRLNHPFLIAKAVDGYLSPILRFKDDDYPKENLYLGQDATFGVGRKLPYSESVGKNESELKEKMNKLLDIFAAGDSSGKAKRLFGKFYEKKQAVTIFRDAALAAATESHENFIAFSNATLGIPGAQGANPKKIRIHQALKNANWDINKVSLIADLGVPAFNLGSKVRGTEDFNNGLGLMINGVQYVFVYVQAYEYDSTRRQYTIALEFVLYDVFGLDDDDLKEFGGTWTNAGQGITAWWQLQHQYGYAPLITRAEIRKNYTVSTFGQ